MLNPITESDLKKEGFPEGHANAFLQIAQQLNCVIGTRTPGEACEMLLSQDYDAKGFHVKTKSCTWGPMAGFVCMDPFLNKTRVAGAFSNLKSTLHALRDAFENSNGKPVTSSAFQISIDDQRLEWLKVNRVDGGQYTELSSQALQYKSADISVVFLKRKLSATATVWDLYFDIGKFYRLTEVDPKSLATALASATKAMLKQGSDDTQQGASGDSIIDDFWKLVDSKNYLTLSQAVCDACHGNSEYANYVPLMGLTNPYPPYEDAFRYLNVVTGDYDLYLVWPQQATQDDARIAGMTKDLKDMTIVEREQQSVFGRVYGNISQRIFDAAQMINSLMPHKYPFASPNRIFHSDEGGRPYLDSVDNAILFSPEGKIYRIDGAADLAESINYFHGLGFHCFVNKGWERELLSKDPDLLPKMEWSPML